jgi:hypothetical protein
MNTSIIISGIATAAPLYFIVKSIALTINNK